ncbi:MAG: OmpA family protein [Labilithrix sp.]|nr:OmpA family protein [Labilithrix sp.]
MEGPRLGVVSFVLAIVALSIGARGARADERRAIDRLEPSERGSEWIANESLDMRGRLRPSLGYVVSYARRPLVVAPEGRAPVSDLANLHLGASLVLVDRLRLSADLPVQLYASGEPAASSGVVVPPPSKSAGVGDLRFGFDVRLFGEHGRRPPPITGAIGIQVWVPTGLESQWASDGTFRARPRAMLAGEVGRLLWAAQLGVFARERPEITGAAAIGVRVASPLVIGPEIFASTIAADAFSRRGTPVEALLGVHWLVDGTARISAAFGGGLGDGDGAPAWRGVLAVEWVQPIPPARRSTDRGGPGRGPRGASAEPDEDRDGVPDAVDACPRVVGVATSDPKTHGCPPDADGDGVDDLSDACPTAFGVATSDPATNGCPDRDRDKDGIENDLDACPDDRGVPDVDPRRHGCPLAFVRGDRVVLLDPFEWKGAELAPGPTNEARLTAVLAAVLKLPEGRKLLVEGHTDDRGDKRLGGARAAAVGKWLVEHGVDGARVTTAGVGSERPVATNETESGRAENRRIEIHLR